MGIISVLAINDIQRRNPFICEHLNAPERFPEDTPGDWSARQGFLALLVPRCIDMQRRERIRINPAVVKRGIGHRCFSSWERERASANFIKITVTSHAIGPLNSAHFGPTNQTRRCRIKINGSHLIQSNCAISSSVRVMPKSLKRATRNSPPTSRSLGCVTKVVSRFTFSCRLVKRLPATPASPPPLSRPPPEFKREGENFMSRGEIQSRRA